MLTVLVTGLIGSGKTEVCRYLEKQGIPVYYSDDRTKALYRNDPALLPAIEKATGLKYSDFRAIFTDTAKREALESVVYPRVLEDFGRWRSALGSPIAVMESAIALSKPVFARLFDKVILVRAGRETRLSRNPEAAAREASQHDIDESLADFIIDNDSTIESLHQKTDNIIDKLI